MIINSGLNATYGIRSQYFSDQYSKNRIVRDLVVGLTALRGTKDIVSSVSAETPYLPKFPNEPDEFYILRVARTYLTNYFKRAITSDSGKILANNVMISIDGSTNDDIPEPFNGWVQNMNLAGDNLTMVTQSQLQAGMLKGVSLAMIDFDAGLNRPYLRSIDVDSVIAFKSDARTGKLSYIKFFFDYVSDSEEDYNTESSIFELTPTTWTISDSNNEVLETGDIIRYRNGKTRITDEIPVVEFYTNKLGKMKAESPYQTLAELTIEHFQVYSDIKNMMFYALTPILTAKNVPADFTIEMMASYMMVRMPETGEKSPELDWTQVDSAAIQEGQKQLEGIERRISTFTIDANALRPGAQTATQTSIESQGSNAALRSFAVALSEHVQNILEVMMSYTLESDKKIKGYIAPEFNSMESDKEMRVLMEMRRNLDLSSLNIVDAAIQRKLLPPDFDKAANAEGLIKELDEMLKYESAKASFNSAPETAPTNMPDDLNGDVPDGLLAGNGEEQITDKPRDA